VRGKPPCLSCGWVSNLVTLLCCSAMVMTQDKSGIYCCTGEGHYGVTQYRTDPGSCQWIQQVTLKQNIRIHTSTCKLPFNHLCVVVTERPAPSREWYTWGTAAAETGPGGDNPVGNFQ
jgi:hypothetical protein